ncbi:hypothetical protein QT972_07080 [Microcoleus sp. herbarium7]
MRKGLGGVHYRTTAHLVGLAAPMYRLTLQTVDTIVTKSMMPIAQIIDKFA